MNYFILFFMIYEATRYTRYQKLQTTQGRNDGAMEIKRNIYLRIILLINYMMEKNLFVYVECSSVKHTASWFFVRKNIIKKKKRKERE